MGTAKAVSTGIDQISDWANPILVKETRQALKSRQFVATFMLLLAASWLISLFGMLLAGEALEYGAVGREFFFAYYMVLVIAVAIIVPFSAYRSLLNERDLNTFELLNITALTPRQIVWGKLLSSLVQVFIYYSAIAPFIAFTSLLQGFDLARGAFLLVMTTFLSLMLSMTTLMLSTLAKQRHWQALNALGIFALLVWLFFGLFFSAGSFMMRLVRFDDPDFWWGLGVFLLVATSYFILFQQIAVAQLTFESDNRSTGIRLICAGQFWLLWLLFFAYLGYQTYILSRGATYSKTDLMPFAIASIVHWSIVALFMVTERDQLSRRVMRGLPERRLFRFLLTPFLPGGARGYLCLLAHLACLWLISTVLLAYASGSTMGHPVQYAIDLVSLNRGVWNTQLLLVTAMCAYVVFYLGLGCAIGRWLCSASSEIKPAHSRVLAVLLFAAGTLAPLIPSSIDMISWRDSPELFVTNPFFALNEISRGRSTTTDNLVLSISVLAVISLLLNFRALKNGITEITRADVKKRQQPAAELETKVASAELDSVGTT